MLLTLNLFKYTQQTKIYVIRLTGKVIKCEAFFFEHTSPTLNKLLEINKNNYSSEVATHKC